MSFESQERALFDLLFDADLRENFCQNRTGALEAYGLDPDELEDFCAIRADALQMDAQMRANLVLAQLCRSYPVSFSIVSSLPDWKTRLRSLIGTGIMRTAPVERTTAFGAHFREFLLKQEFGGHEVKHRAVAILDAELGMSWTGNTLKQYVIEHRREPDPPPDVPDDWSARPVTLAAFVSAAMIPRPYGRLKQAFCPGDERALWTHLGRTPTPARRVTAALGREDPRLLVSRAVLDHMSLCEPAVSHKTTELSEGFAPLFQHINGQNSVDQLLVHLKGAGAANDLLKSVRSGFHRLFSNGMLRLV